ncbi:MAG: SGNH/GDSL hydrolase family protein [Bacteroidaceae bacterium]|nr:SGNH/GDSL hydrolase family protein [Bacteroidaceae bacterium]
MKRLIVFFALVLCTTCIYAQEEMHVVFLGDSNTWIGGDKCDVSRGWNYWLRGMLKPTTCRSYARSGATWVHTDKYVRDTKENTARLSDNNVITNQIYRLQDAVESGTQAVPTLILIMAGTNDVWFRQDILSTLEHVAVDDVYMLQESFPDARIALITPMQNTKVSAELVREAADMLETVAIRMDVLLIDASGSDVIDREQELKRPTFTRDGVHMNEVGAKRLASFVNSKL